jgi:hypothetical protein
MSRRRPTMAPVTQSVTSLCLWEHSQLRRTASSRAPARLPRRSVAGEARGAPLHEGPHSLGRVGGAEQLGDVGPQPLNRDRIALVAGKVGGRQHGLDTALSRW